MSDWVAEYFGSKPRRDSRTNTPARTDLSRVVPTPASPSGNSTQPESKRSFSPDLENLSIGLGRGFTSQLEGLKTLVTQPGEVYEGLKRFAGQVVDDPRILADMAREYGVKATSGPLGFGEVMGEFISPIPGASRVPKASIVEPKGNLNLKPAIRVESIKGPEKQTPQSILNQVQKIPGVTKEGFEEATSQFRQLMSRYEGEPVTVSKTDFEKTVPPSEYSKVDLVGGSDSAWEHYIDMATEMANNDPDAFSNDVLHRLGFDYSNPANAENLRRFMAYLSPDRPPDDAFIRQLERHGVRGSDDLMGIENEVIERYAREIADNDQGGEIGGQGQYSYGQYQRLMATPEMDDPGYFETGVTHPSMKGQKYRHFSATQEPLIGHIRGTYLSPDRPPEAYEIVHGWSDGVGKRGIMDTFEAKPNSVVIEELQSDAQKIDFAQKGAMRQVHGTLFKAAIQDALERGADTVYLPTSVPIAAVRGKMPKDYTSIYDQQVVKEGLNPLKKIPGVTITPIENKGQVTYFEIGFAPEAKDYILKGPGQLAPGYRRGGEVKRYGKGGEVEKKDTEVYDENAIEAMAEEIRKKLYGSIRSGKEKIAGATGLLDIKRKAETIPERYFSEKSMGGGEGDAMRHMLFQAMLTQKLGETPANVISRLYEYTSPGQTAAEREMDFLNDALGRQIGKQTADEKRMAELALKYIDSGQARVLPKNQRTGY